MKHLIISIFLLTTLNGCTQQNIQFNGRAQGTYYYISYYDSQNRNLQNEIDSILDHYNTSVSVYDTNSIISRFNKNTKDILQDDIFIDNLKLALEIAETTGGRFDPTVGPLVDAWGFGFNHKKNLDSMHLDSLKTIIGYEKIDIVNGKAVKKDSRIHLDFNAIAQGYSVDMISEFIERKGIDDYLVDIGGEVKAKGSKPGGQHWKVGIEKPAKDKMSERQLQTRINLKNMAVATSGNYRKYYVKDGTKYSHTINPETARPVSHNLLSATVISDNCAKADAYATAFMVMGKMETIQFLQEHPETNLEVMLIFANEKGKYQTYYSTGFKKYIIK